MLEWKIQTPAIHRAVRLQRVRNPFLREDEREITGVYLEEEKKGIPRVNEFLH